MLPILVPKLLPSKAPLAGLHLRVKRVWGKDVGACGGQGAWGLLGRKCGGDAEAMGEGAEPAVAQQEVQKDDGMHKGAIW